jgi:hypothetical protein
MTTSYNAEALKVVMRLVRDLTGLKLTQNDLAMELDLLVKRYGVPAAPKPNPEPGPGEYIGTNPTVLRAGGWTLYSGSTPPTIDPRALIRIVFNNGRVSHTLRPASEWAWSAVAAYRVELILPDLRDAPYFIGPYYGYGFGPPQ